MTGTPQDRRNIQAARSLATVVALTAGSLYALGGDVHPPHGNPLVYALAVTWLSAFPIGMLRELNGAEGVQWVLVVNTPFNVYPIMLQRRNRGRMWRLLRRRQYTRHADVSGAAAG